MGLKRIVKLVTTAVAVVFGGMFVVAAIGVLLDDGAELGSAGAGPAALPEAVRGADQDLTELYRYAIYGGAECYTDEIEARFLTYCTAPDTGGSFGGLWEIVPAGDGGYELLAINGKAKQHARRTGMVAEEVYTDDDIPELVRHLMAEGR